MANGLRGWTMAWGAVLVVLGACSSSSPPVTEPPGDTTPTDTTPEPDTSYVAGESYLGEDGFVEYIAGDLPVILSAPHGGDKEPAGIPDRTAARCGGSATTVKDMNTRELALAMAEAMHERFGGYPHVVINHLHRSKLDPNRNVSEAACGNTRAEGAWGEFQAFLDRARDRVQQTHGRGWYMDMHGHGHAIQRLELGYLLGRGDLNVTDEALNASAASLEKSSIQTLAADSDRPFAEVLRGPLSLGSLYEAQDIPAVPSAEQPSPGEDPYFTGGYNTRRHACSDIASGMGGESGGPICGVQIEANFSGVRDTEESRSRFAEATTTVLETYLDTHWNLEITPASP